MYQEELTLPVGILKDGRQLRKASLNNQTQRITRAAQGHPDFLAAKDDYERGLVVFGHRLSVPELGEGPLSLDMMLDLDQDDINAIVDADGRLQARIRRFPDTAQGTDAGASIPGASV